VFVASSGDEVFTTHAAKVWGSVQREATRSALLEHLLPFLGSHPSIIVHVVSSLVVSYCS